MNAIEQLLDEHAFIMDRLVDLRGVVADLATRGATAVPAAGPVIDQACHLLDTVLAHHARKEEEALFPAMERVIGAHGPTAVMRMEHQGIHDQGALLRATLRELNEVEHPRLEESRKVLQQSVADGAGASTLRAHAERVLELVDQHFYKEEQILFPMAERLLERSALDEVAALMQAIDEAAASTGPLEQARR
jgi:hemerythrin-like domain-containing protein